jgi:hypothetical protein
MDATPLNNTVFYEDNVDDDVFLALEGYRKAPSKKDSVVAKAVVGALGLVPLPGHGSQGGYL